jgi:hypothetical protein
MSKKIVFILIISLASSFIGASENNYNFYYIFNNISDTEKLDIKELFDFLFKHQVFAYTLYGDKPMSFSEPLDDISKTNISEYISLKDYCQETLENFVESKKAFKKRWDTWHRYRDKFQLKNYLLLEKKIANQSRIFLINVAAFEGIVNKNIKLFRKIVGANISAEVLLEQFKDEETDVWDILKHHTGLIGILLGFGRHNAMLFQKREKLYDLLENPLTNSESIEKKLNQIGNRLSFFHEHDPQIIASINRVMFMADSNHPETIKLKKKYDKLNQKINEIYSRDDWFEQTLSQLVSD